MLKKPELTVSIIGAGKLAWSLIPALQQAEVLVEGIFSRNVSNAQQYADVYNLGQWGNISDCCPSDLLLLTVSDTAISSVAQTMKLEEHQILCHCSGSISIEALAPATKRGVFYPMQAFTTRKLVDFHRDRVPIFVEGSSFEITSRLLELGRRMSDRTEVLSSNRRKRLHLGAVLACNFPNLLFQYAAKQVEGVGLEAYESLIRHQVDQALALGPEEAQTGPAIRGDEETIRSHLEQLEAQPQLQELYRMISLMINPDLSDSL